MIALGIEPLCELFFFDLQMDVSLRYDAKKKASGESPARRERPKKTLLFGYYHSVNNLPKT